MFDVIAVAGTINAFGVPVIGLAGLLIAKLSVAAAQRCDRILFGVLILTLAATCHSLLTDDAALLTHALTLTLVMLGAILLPQARPVDPDQA